MRKIISTLFLALVSFLLFSEVASAQIIEPHPACSAPNSACWPTRKVNQWSCTDCSHGWFCSGDTTISCAVVDPYGNTSGDSSLCGGKGPCMWLCDGTKPQGFCWVLDENVICNNVTATTCQWRDRVRDCVYDFNSGCSLTTSIQTLGCCGPGSVTPTSTPPPATATPTPPPASCSISLTNASLTGGPGASLGKIVSIASETSGTIDRVDFTSGDSSIATVTTPDTTRVDGFRTTVTAIGVGTTAYTAIATMEDEGGVTCTATANINVTKPNAWWQVEEGDIVTNANIVSLIPPTCILPGCNPFLISNSPGNPPGLPTFGGNIIPTLPNISLTNWNAASLFSSQTLANFVFYQGRIPATVGPSLPNIVSASITNSDLVTGGARFGGYYWYLYDGTGTSDLTIDSDIVLGARRVVLFVRNASLNITGNINLNKGRGFFLAVVDEDINVDPAVGGGLGPHLEGLYHADGQIKTGTNGASDVRLVIRGSLVGLGNDLLSPPDSGVVFQRNLGDNSRTPGDLVIYALDQALLFPPSLSPRHLVWQEVAP